VFIAKANSQHQSLEGLLTIKRNTGKKEKKRKRKHKLLHKEQSDACITVLIAKTN